MREQLHERLIVVLKHYAEVQPQQLPIPTDALLQKMMSVAVGEHVSNEYVPMMLEDIALSEYDPKGIAWRQRPEQEKLNDFNVIVIGAGMSGLCTAIRLKQADIPFKIFEKNDTVGGVWYQNTYPGCGVDTPNHFYSYSFEPAYHWSHYFSKRDELYRYFENCADKYDLRRYIQFNTEVMAADYDEQQACWLVTVRDADGNETVHQAKAIVCAVGQLNRPYTPDIHGLSDFTGTTFHTGEWRHDFDLKGKRVAVIGAGASAMQTIPSIAPEVESLHIFQRSPHWVVPNPNYLRSVAPELKWLLQHLPFYAKWYRFRLFWGFSDGLHQALQKDPLWDMPDISLNATNEKHRRSIIRFIKRELGEESELLDKVIPDYPPYGKRILIDNNWYKTLKRDNVSLITDPIERINKTGIVTDTGNEYPLDVIVFATGFQAARMLWPMAITGRNGCSIRELWGDENPRAYLGVTVPGFPNFFILYGPNTNLGHGGSAIFHTECQVRYTMKCLRELIEKDYAAMEVRQDVHDDYNQRVDAAHQRMVWTHEGMDNWYKNSKGRVITNSPWRLVDYWKMTAELNIDDYELRE